MGFDGAIVLLDCLAIVTRTEESISLEHDKCDSLSFGGSTRSDGTNVYEDVRLLCVLLPGRAWPLHALRV